jgi:hypothetical protein
MISLFVICHLFFEILIKNGSQNDKLKNSSSWDPFFITGGSTQVPAELVMVSLVEPSSEANSFNSYSSQGAKPLITTVISIKFNLDFRL